jgi:hypothetical protein
MYMFVHCGRLEGARNANRSRFLLLISRSLLALMHTAGRSMYPPPHMTCIISRSLLMHTAGRSTGEAKERNIYICICVCIETYTYVCIFVCVYIYTHMYVCMYVMYARMYRLEGGRG